MSTQDKNNDDYIGITDGAITALFTLIFIWAIGLTVVSGMKTHELMTYQKHTRKSYCSNTGYIADIIFPVTSVACFLSKQRIENKAAIDYSSTKCRAMVWNRGYSNIPKGSFVIINGVYRTMSTIRLLHTREILSNKPNTLIRGVTLEDIPALHSGTVSLSEEQCQDQTE